MAFTDFIIIMISSSLVYQSTAQTSCSGVLGGSIDSDVTVTGPSCTLSGASVTGSVFVGSGRTLTLTSGTAVDGNIQADGSGDINVADGSVEGVVSMLNAAITTTVTIGSPSEVGSVFLDNAGSAVIKGSSGDVESVMSKGLTFTGANVQGSLSVTHGNGDITVCGSTISDAISITESTGDFAAFHSGTCGQSTLGSISIERGTGALKLKDTIMTSGDISVAEQAGLIDIQGVSFSELSVDSGSGEVKVKNSVSSNGLTISKRLTGKVDIDLLTSSEDVTVEDSGEVTITRSTFGGKKVTVKLNSGPVVVDDNLQFDLDIEENSDVTITDNTIDIAVVKKNTIQTLIKDNEITDLLDCDSNVPTPVLMGNIVSSSSGQC